MSPAVSDHPSIGRHSPSGRRTGEWLLAACVWLYLAGVIWVCFLLPHHGDWVAKLAAARALPGLPWLVLTTSLAAWLCRERHCFALLGLTLTVLGGALVLPSPGF